MEVDVEKSASSIEYGTFKLDDELKDAPKSTEVRRHLQRPSINILISFILSLALVGAFTLFAYLVVSIFQH
jgi:hypothetical protein